VPLRKEQGLFLLFSLTAPYTAPKKQPFFGWFFQWPWQQPPMYQSKFVFSFKEPFRHKTDYSSLRIKPDFCFRLFFYFHLQRGIL